MYLKAHLTLNDLANVTVVEAAVAEQSGMAYFDESRGSAEGRVAADGNLQVRTVSLDDLVSTGRMPPSAYMKIDVEGGELGVLAGAKSLLADAKPTIFLATHARDIHGECCRLLGSLGYELKAIGGGELNDASEIMAQRRG